MIHVGSSVNIALHEMFHERSKVVEKKVLSDSFARFCVPLHAFVFYMKRLFEPRAL